MDRSCSWMSGPKDATVRVSATKWWLAISRDILVNDYRRQMSARNRPSVTCHRTPKFVSPLVNRTS
jgi:hypothetical protein